MWESIPGFYPYFITRCGKVGSKYKRGSRGSTTDHIQELNQHISNSGYRYVNIYINKKRHTKFVHRLVALSFFGDSHLFVNHKNLNKLDNRVENLEYVTARENWDHAFNKGVMKMPPNNGPSRRKLSKEDVFSILDSGFGCEILGRKYKIQPSTIVKIKSGKAYVDWVNEYRLRAASN